MTFQPYETESLNYEIETEQNFFEMYDSSEEELDNDQIDDDYLQVNDVEIPIPIDTHQEYEENENSTAYVFSSALDSSLSLKDKLSAWAAHYNLSREAVNALLSILRVEHPILPKDKRTLCNTPRYSEIFQMDNGYYLHIDLKNSLLQFMAKNNNHSWDNDIYIDINIDGVPISKSSSSTLWPILINIVGFDEVICVGTFYGTEKPTNVDNYLNRFVNDFCEIHRNGLLFANKMYNLYIRAITADAPARAFLLNIHTHSGYSSCHKCSIRGKYILNRVTFPNCNSTPRTDAEFRAKADSRHHLTQNTTIIEKLPIDCVRGVVVDYMHAALEGVLKQLMVQWIVLRKKFYSLKKSKIELLCNNIVHIASQLPSEFSRCPRPLQYLRRYKATEFRQFLLYTLPIITINILHEDIYNHFLKFHCAIRIMCSTKLCVPFIDVAKNLIKSFIEEYDEIYDDHQYSFNVHSLIHLCEDVIYFQAPLDSFSCFKFENFLQSLKKLVKSGNHPLQQINNRYVEQFLNEGCFKKEKQFPKYRDGSYKYVIFNGSKYSNKPPNNFCFSYEYNCFIKILIIKNSCSSKSLIIYGKKLLELSPIYTYPMNSTDLGMFKCETIYLDSSDIFELDENIVKAVNLNTNNVSYFLTLIH